MHCHEEWEYDDASGVQRLKRLGALCELCHALKHSTGLVISSHIGNYWFRENGPNKAPGESLKAWLEILRRFREEGLRERFIKEEAAKPPGEQRFWSDDLEGWPGRYRRELEERGDEEALRWLDDLDQQHPKKLVEHFVEVNNGVSLAVLEEHIQKAKETWMERSRREWRVDFGEFTKFFS